MAKKIIDSKEKDLETTVDEIIEIEAKKLNPSTTEEVKADILVLAAKLREVGTEQRKIGKSDRRFIHLALQLERIIIRKVI